MGLTVTEVKNAKKGPSAYKLWDDGGLFLFVSTTGARSWRLKYRFGGKEKVLTFGLFPEVALAEARDRRDAARRLLRENKDPGVERLRARHQATTSAATTLEAVARAWHDGERARWSEGQSTLVLRALERDVFPDLGKLPVAAVDDAMVLAALRKIEARGAIETAKRVRGYLVGVFKRARSERLVRENPAADLGDALQRTPKNAKQPALVTVPALLKLQRTVDGSTSGPAVKLASRLLALTSVRVGVLRAATWDEFEGIDWSAPDAPAPTALWRISADRMKLDLDDKANEAMAHDVPLPPQAVECLRALRVLTGRIDLLFPNGRSTRTPMSDSAVSTLYKRLDGGRYKGRHVPHGWRAAFSTIMNEWAAEDGREGDTGIIDLMLAHRPKGISSSEYAYNRARFAKRRRELATIWVDMITPGLVPAMSLLRAPAADS